MLAAPGPALSSPASQGPAGPGRPCPCPCPVRGLRCSGLPPFKPGAHVWPPHTGSFWPLKSLGLFLWVHSGQSGEVKTAASPPAAHTVPLQRPQEGADPRTPASSRPLACRPRTHPGPSKEQQGRQAYDQSAQEWDWGCPQPSPIRSRNVAAATSSPVTSRRRVHVGPGCRGSWL